MKKINRLKQKLLHIFSYRILLNAVVLIFTLVPSILLFSMSKSYISNNVMQKYISNYVGSIEAEFSDNISSFVYRANVQSLYFTTKNSLYVTLFNKNLTHDEKYARLSDGISAYLKNNTLMSGISIIDKQREVFHFCPIPEDIALKNIDEITKTVNSGKMYMSEGFEYGGNYYFAVAVKMRNYNTNYTAGELVMYIPESALSQMYQTYTLDGGEVFIMHGGKILSHSNKSLIGSEIFLGDKFFDGENTEIGKHYLMSRRAVDANSIIEGLEIVTITPKTVFDNMLKTLNLFLIILLFAAIVFSIPFSVIVSKKLLSEIEILIKNMYSFEKSPTEYKPMFKLYEIRELENVFKNMTRKINILIENIKDEKEKQRIAELSALSAQINPHFIYNTLDSISWILLMKNDTETYKIIYALANFFRIALHGGMEVITVEKELTHLKSYLVIQNMRFPDKFEVTYDISGEIMQLKMVKIILQPIVENSIKHGFDKMSGGGKISVKGFLTDNGDIKFVISDNGCGMDFDPLTAKLKPKKGSSGYGISNINRRLKLACGEGYGLKFISEKGKGTTVEILIKPQRD